MIEYKRSRLQIVVLAAGFSVRLGRPKALAKIHGISLIGRTVAVLARVTRQRIVVVTAPRATRLRVELRGHRVSFLDNPARAKGLSTSVSRAVRNDRSSRATLFLPVDLAELTPRDIARLICRWHAAPRRVVASRIANRASIPLILPKFLYVKAKALVGDIGLRDLVAGLPAAQRSLVDLPSAVRDIDTRQDLADARRRALRLVGTGAS